MSEAKIVKNLHTAPIEIAKQLVYEYIRKQFDKSDPHPTFGLDEVYVVWFSYTLRNWKALLSTTLPDQMYYEVTYSAEKSECYLDAYKKWENLSFTLREEDNG